MVAKLCRFYGLSPDQLSVLDAEMVNTLHMAITPLEAQEMLMLLKVADFPTMKKEARSTLHKEMFKLAFPHRKRKGITLDDIERVLRDGR